MTRPLYHFTTADCVLAIKTQGLLPSIDETFAPCDPVVWLTEQPDVTLDPETAAAMVHAWGQYEAPLADLDGIRNGDGQSGKGLMLGPLTQWKYGKRGEQLYIDYDGREITATFKPPQDDLVRLTVEVPDDGKLCRFVKWPKRPKYKAATWFYRFAHVRLWWVYLGRIASDAITAITGDLEKARASLAAHEEEAE